ncbi:MAG: coenzyme A pyrophosphatase [Acidimicrobiaceae bacterium]|nr:coenzyme A pyrophosphatase [Acidimicrobiaceae bacterium]
MESPLSDLEGIPDLSFRANLRQRVQNNLDSHPQINGEDQSLRKASVGIIIVESQEGKAGFILTRRSKGLRNHSYQYALPGGRIDLGETREETVLREVREEIGISVSSNEILGCLDEYETRSGFSITPVVLWVEDLTTMVPEPNEVDEILIIDLEELFRNDSPRWVDIDESEKQVLQLPIKNRLIHAPTAALLYQFKEVGIAGNLLRTDHVEEPIWAWK